MFVRISTDHGDREHNNHFGIDQDRKIEINNDVVIFLSWHEKGEKK